MTLAIALVLGIFAVALVLFVTEWGRMDLACAVIACDPRPGVTHRKEHLAA